MYYNSGHISHVCTYIESHWCTRRLSPAQNLENRRDQFAAMRHQKQRVLFLQKRARARNYSIRVFMIRDRIIVYCWRNATAYFIIVAIAASAVRRKKTEMKSRSPLYCPKCPRIAIQSPSGSSLFEQSKPLDQAEGKIAARFKLLLIKRPTLSQWNQFCKSDKIRKHTKIFVYEKEISL